MLKCSSLSSAHAHGKNHLKNYSHHILDIFGGLLILSGLGLLAGWLDSTLSQAIAQTSSRPAGPNWPGYFRVGGWIAFCLGVGFVSSRHLIGGMQRLSGKLRNGLESSDRWLGQKLARQVDLSSTRFLRWPPDFKLADWLIIFLFALLALIYQLSMSRHGFPTVILGGDAANIASFAAGRAFPNLFLGDAILGDLNNIGLYVTVHLPITIGLEKLLGNFGLAYSLLLFPHVFLQFFSYYLLGRVLFGSRYWAFLFSLAVSAPMSLAGGEVWGAVGDGMPRFTYQVLIPFILILLLASWRMRPERWPWIMIAAGLMAFVHPVSTPTWAFALWLGFWPIMPSAYDLRRKLLEMFKLGAVLGLALLPYVSIYLTYHQGGRGSTDYDLVYTILLNYFPYSLLDIPAAVSGLVETTSQSGLLWFGLAGLLLTFILFKTERGRLIQMLTWMSGIAFITILVPLVEQSIERAFRIVPLQTELMRGMRYLVPFLFIFGFYLLAELTNRAARTRLTRTVFAVGALLTLSWLLLNPPYPLAKTPEVVQCWLQGQLICPDETDYANALAYIRNDTPENAVFVVFLTNRWSGIEVRYLGLRPMAYAYKDRGQLAFTNLEALRIWNYYLQRENAIYSRNNSPTLELQQQRIIDFALDAEANYLLTDFPFPPDVQTRLAVTTAYENETFRIIKLYDLRR
jgi:hypothetical protein